MNSQQLQPVLPTYVNKVLLEHRVSIHLFKVYGCFHTIMTPLNGCNTGHNAHKI